MKMTMVLFQLIVLTADVMVAQTGDLIYRRAGILDGNSTQTVFGNWGVIGQPGTMAHRGAWRNWSDGYIGDVAPMLGIEFPIRDYNGDGTPDTVHSVITCPISRPCLTRDEDPVTGKAWTFEPLPNFFAPDPPNQSPAISNRPETWPTVWPDHPEWGTGVWNGLYGPNVFVGSQETYFQMDDQNDERFNFAQNNPRHIVFHPDSTNPSRNGAGIRMSVRYIQVAHPLYNDVLFRVFDIKNESQYHYSKVVLGSLTGTYIGVTDVEDAGEYNDDVTIYYSSTNSIVSWDFDEDCSRNPRWRGPVGMFSEAFVQAPNHNRVASLFGFGPSYNVSLGDDNGLWTRMQPGLFHPAPCVVQDTVAICGSDADYFYGSEYFSLDPSETKRIVSVLAYGYIKEAIFQKVLLARALWNANFDTLLVQSEVGITNFSSHRYLNGTVPITWTTQQSGGNVDIYFSPDAGRNWRTIVRGSPNVGVYSWNTNAFADCSFGLLRIFVNDTSGNAYRFNQGASYFTINNTTNGAPFIQISNEELTDTTIVDQETYDLRLLIGDPESQLLSVSAFYRVDNSSPWALFDAFSAPSDTIAQLHAVRLAELPNSDHFQLKLQVYDGSLFYADSTGMFKKQTPRTNVPPTNFQVLSGFAEVPMSVHIVDQTRVRSDTYIITFDDTSSFTGKTFSVYDSTLGVYRLQNSPVQPGIESPLFDGLALYTEDVMTALERGRSRWGGHGYQYTVSVLQTVGAGGDTILGYRQPHDYRIVFHDVPVDTSVTIDSLFLVATPIPYHVFDVQTGLRIRVGALEFPGFRAMVFIEGVRGRNRLTWEVAILDSSLPHEGDTLFISTKKGLSIYDSLEVSDLVVSAGGNATAPVEFELYQNYPNPFNPATTIRYALLRTSHVTLTVFNILGQQLTQLVNEQQQAGYHEVEFGSKSLASGVYFYRIQAGDFVASRKLLLLK